MICFDNKHLRNYKPSNLGHSLLKSLSNFCKYVFINANYSQLKIINWTLFINKMLQLELILEAYVNCGLFKFKVSLNAKSLFHKFNV